MRILARGDRAGYVVSIVSYLRFMEGFSVLRLVIYGSRVYIIYDYYEPKVGLLFVIFRLYSMC